MSKPCDYHSRHDGIAWPGCAKCERMRKCSNCFQFKAETEFYVKRSKAYRSGESRQSRCKACNAEVARVYAQRRRARLIAEGWDRLHGRSG